VTDYNDTEATAAAHKVNPPIPRIVRGAAAVPIRPDEPEEEEQDLEARVEPEAAAAVEVQPPAPAPIPYTAPTDPVDLWSTAPSMVYIAPDEEERFAAETAVQAQLEAAFEAERAAAAAAAADRAAAEREAEKRLAEARAALEQAAMEQADADRAAAERAVIERVAAIERAAAEAAARESGVASSGSPESAAARDARVRALAEAHERTAREAEARAARNAAMQALERDAAEHWAAVQSFRTDPTPEVPAVAPELPTEKPKRSWLDRLRGKAGADKAAGTFSRDSYDRSAAGSGSDWPAGSPGSAEVGPAGTADSGGGWDRDWDPAWAPDASGPLAAQETAVPDLPPPAPITPVTGAPVGPAASSGVRPGVVPPAPAKASAKAAAVPPRPEAKETSRSPLLPPELMRIIEKQMEVEAAAAAAASAPPAAPSAPPTGQPGAAGPDVSPAAGPASGAPASPGSTVPPQARPVGRASATAPVAPAPGVIGGQPPTGQIYGSPNTYGPANARVDAPSRPGARPGSAGPGSGPAGSGVLDSPGTGLGRPGAGGFGGPGAGGRSQAGPGGRGPGPGHGPGRPGAAGYAPRPGQRPTAGGQRRPDGRPGPGRSRRPANRGLVGAVQVAFAMVVDAPSRTAHWYRRQTPARRRMVATLSTAGLAMILVAALLPTFFTEAPRQTNAGSITPTGGATSPAGSSPSPSTSPTRASLFNSGPVSVDTPGWYGWALMDRVSGKIIGSPNMSAVNDTASMIKAWIGADYLRQQQEKGLTPSDARLHEISIMIRNSDNDAAQDLFVVLGKNASINRLIDICRLTDTYGVKGFWSNTMVSPRDAVRMGNCIGDGRAAGTRWTEWLLNEMRHTTTPGNLGILPALPPDIAANTAVKNGWIDRTATQEWHVNCMAIGDTWVLAVEQRYPIQLGVDHGWQTCQSVTEQLLR
jgi:hypothetical protein